MREGCVWEGAPRQLVPAAQRVRLAAGGVCVHEGFEPARRLTLAALAFAFYCYLAREHALRVLVVLFFRAYAVESG